jgi:hypothetical protein
VADQTTSADVHAADTGDSANREAGAHDASAPKEAGAPRDATVADHPDGSRDGALDAREDGGVYHPPLEGGDARPDALDATVDGPVDAPIPDSAVCHGVTVDPLEDPANCGRCGHDCKGGACASGACQPVVVTSGTWGVAAVTSDQTYVYWEEIQNGCSCYTDIYRWPLAGDAGAPEKLAALQDNPTDPVPYGTSLYYGLIYSTAIEALSATGVVSTLTTDVGEPQDVAVDGVNVYWTDTKRKAVLAVPIGGGSVTTIAPGTSDMTFIVVDNDYVYWSEPSENAVVKAAKTAGSTAITLTSVLPSPAGLAAQAGSLYFSSDSLAVAGGGIYRIAQGGAGFTPLAQPQTGAYFIALDATDVYWTGTGVGKAPLNGGATTTIEATGETYGITASADSVFWVDYANGTGALHRLVK